MAMDALKNLSTNIPSWLTRLDELSGQIDQRQTELAALATPGSKSAESRSLRNKGSTESLKPKDDGPAHISLPEDTPVTQLLEVASAKLQQPTTPPPDGSKPNARTSPGSGALSASQKQPQRDAISAVNSRARGQVKKRIRSSSVASGDVQPTIYRTRSMIIVYYDSFVQSFFDELVRFVSSSRNLMRKAKMAARVAHIKKMAEVDISNEASGDEGRLPDTILSLRYMSARRFGPMSGMGRAGFGPPGATGQPDAFDNLDKGLESVQSTCEHGAHQFLRDADCNEEIKKIQGRLQEVLDSASKESDRIQREEPELAKETSEPSRVRTLRPISVRRDLSALQKDGPALVPDDAANAETVKSKPARNSYIEPADAALEVDTNMDGDEGIEIEAEIQKLKYRSTRYMRPRVS